MKEELVAEGLVLIRQWFPSQAKKIGRRNPLAADRLWDLLIDALLVAVERYKGGIAFRAYLGCYVKYTRQRASSWAKAKKRQGEVPWPTTADGRPMDPPDPRGESPLEDLIDALSPAERETVREWIDRRRDGKSSRSGERSKMSRIVRKMRKRFRTQGGQ